ncbi:MAG TPA: hypothetical protein VF735_07430 [Pyrinomonadaceae bacterium]|jgi:hypothetical protein
MIKIWLSLLLVYVLVFTAAPVLAGSARDKQAQTEEQIKTKVARLGKGSRASVRLRNGTKLKGYIQQAGDTGFVIKDTETGAPVQLLYSDVAKVGDDRGRSLGKKIAIGMGIGFGALLALVAIGFANAD